MFKSQYKLIKKFICLIVFSIFSGCYSDNPEFVMKHVDYEGHELRIDGYYYHQGKHVSGSNQTHVIFLFKNGLMLNPYPDSTHDISEVEQILVRQYEHFKKYNNRWGIFVINGNRLEYEMYDAEGGSVIRYVGRIDNDTTFNLLQSVHHHFGVLSVDKIFHFKKFSPKPDSIKSFIK